MNTQSTRKAGRKQTLAGAFSLLGEVDYRVQKPLEREYYNKFGKTGKTECVLEGSLRLRLDPVISLR
jgi:hypothetical protein